MRKRPKASHAWQLEEISKPSSYKVVGKRKVCKECRLSPLRRPQDDAKSGCLRAQNNISRHRSQHLFSHLTCHSSTSRPQALCCNSHRLDLPEEINLKLHTGLDWTVLTVVCRPCSLTITGLDFSTEEAGLLQPWPDYRRSC